MNKKRSESEKFYLKHKSVISNIGEPSPQPSPFKNGEGEILTCNPIEINNSANDNKDVKNIFPYSLISLFHNKTFAFTLAEVLITLGIIGIVAAMTIPTLISKVQKQQIESQIRENYSSIAQAMKMAENDDIGAINNLGVNLSSNKTWFETFLAPYMKFEQVCYSTGGCWHKYGVVKTLKGSTPTYETKVGESDGLIGYVGVSLTFRTAKGAYFDIDASGAGSTRNLFGVDATSNTIQFYFDVNGDRKPNIIGKDIYILVYDSDKGLVPAGSDRTKDEVKANCETGNGYWCLQYVKDNSWKISDSVWKRAK